MHVMLLIVQYVTFHECGIICHYMWNRCKSVHATVCIIFYVLFSMCSFLLHCGINWALFLFQNFKPVPIMRSNSSCEMSVDHNVYNKIVCQEVHIFQPFSSNDSGAHTTVKQVLTLLTESNSTSEVPGNHLLNETYM
jgi:hypothetical protein